MIHDIFLFIADRVSYRFANVLVSLLKAERGPENKSKWRVIGHIRKSMGAFFLITGHGSYIFSHHQLLFAGTPIFGIATIS